MEFKKTPVITAMVLIGITTLAVAFFEDDGDMGQAAHCFHNSHHYETVPIPQNNNGFSGCPAPDINLDSNGNHIEGPTDKSHTSEDCYIYYVPVDN